jgi:hypothetical protein
MPHLQDETLLRQLAETCDAPLILCHYLLPKAFKGGDLGRRSKALEAVKKVAAQVSYTSSLRPHPLVD